MAFAGNYAWYDDHYDDWVIELENEQAPVVAVKCICPTDCTCLTHCACPPDCDCEFECDCRPNLDRMQILLIRIDSGECWLIDLRPGWLNVAPGTISSRSFVVGDAQGGLGTYLSYELIAEELLQYPLTYIQPFTREAFDQFLEDDAVQNHCVLEHVFGDSWEQQPNPGAWVRQSPPPED